MESRSDTGEGFSVRIIAGLFKNRKIEVPKGLDVRPTTNQMREAVFNVCQSRIDGARFLDLFAGSGAMGLEALSRGAKSATFIENDKRSLKCILGNIENLSAQDKTTVLFGDVLQKIQALKGQYDIIYADPPYEQRESYELLIRYLDKSSLLSEDCVVMMESQDEIKVEDLSRLHLREVRRYGKAKLHLYQ